MNTANLFNKNHFRKDTPLYVSVLLAVLAGLAVYSLFPHPAPVKTVNVMAPTGDCIPEMNIVRSTDHPLARRILLAETKNESTAYSRLKEKLSGFIMQCKTSGSDEISVYFRDLNSGEWFSINGAAMYDPSSLMKVSYLIATLRQAEGNAALLNKQVYFEKHFDGSNHARDFRLTERKYYSIKELLQYMIIYSDEDATALIIRNTDQSVLNKLFIDLGIPAPSLNDKYTISITDYCKFMRILYNSTYLRDDYSEFALDLLTRCAYRDGFLKNLNLTTPVAHNSGETVANNIQQLHEAGIFYVGDSPYILGVMTSGHDLKKQSAVLARISGMAYDEKKRLN